MSIIIPYITIIIQIYAEIKKYEHKLTHCTLWCEKNKWKLKIIPTRTQSHMYVLHSFFQTGLKRQFEIPPISSGNPGSCEKSRIFKLISSCCFMVWFCASVNNLHYTRRNTKAFNCNGNKYIIPICNSGCNVSIVQMHPYRFVNHSFLLCNYCNKRLLY